MKQLAELVANGWGLLRRGWAVVRRNRLLTLSVIIMVAGLVGSAVVTALNPDWMTSTGSDVLIVTESGTESRTDSGRESRSTTIRNLGIVAAALVALPLAVWRGKSADRQAGTAQADLLNKRYQESAAMLGSEVLAVRLAGIYALERLAEEHAQEHHIEVMKLLCACLRHLSESWEPVPVAEMGEGGGSLSGGRLGGWLAEQRADAQAALNAISNCHGRQLELERKADFRLDLRSTDFRGIVLPFVNLSGALLGSANLVDVYMVSWNLSDADLSGADLTDSNLRRTDLSGATLFLTTLTRADFTGSLGSSQANRAIRPPASPEDAVVGATQGQLAEARADPNGLPYLDGVKDAETGEQLDWRGLTLDARPYRGYVQEL